MAKNQKEDNQNVDDVVLDAMPGADPKTEEDAKGYEVDLNFDDPVETEDKPEEEETEEEQDEVETTEEPSEEPEEEAEEESAEDASEDTEDTGEETVLEEHEGDTSEPEGTDEEGHDEAKEPMIPKSRFDEVLAKQKALQKKLDDALAPQIEDVKEAPEFDFDAKEIEYQTLIMEGETEKATQLRAEIRNAEKQQMMFEVQAKMGQTVTQNQEMVDLQTKATQLEAMYPELNQANPEFNQDKTNEVLELRDAYMTQGYMGADALQKAVDLLMPKVQESPKENIVQKKVVEKKKVANTKKKVEAADSQPPTMKGKNKVDKKIEIDNMSVEEFDAIPAETLRRMRGDFG